MSHNIIRIIKIASDLPIDELDIIQKQSRNKNIYYAFHSLNIYFLEIANSKIKVENYKNINIHINDILQKILQSYIENFKKSLFPTIIHEFNILVENNVIIDDFCEFINETSNDVEWLEYFFDKYPVITDLLEKTLNHSISFADEFLTRLNADITLLEKKFNVKFKDFSSVKLSLGDNHNNMRSVVELNFNNKSIFYKPRTLTNENSIYNLFKFLQNLGLQESIIIPKTVSHELYGWMEGITYMGVKDDEELQKFYQNQGINLAIFYITGTTDLIGENIIAHNTFPCYFDLECIFQPNLLQSNQFSIYENSSLASNFICSSVLKSGLLPKYAFVTDKFQGISNSGFSILDGLIPNMIIKQKDGIFTREYEEILIDSDNHHIPDINEERKLASFNVEDILKGFSYAYDLLSENKLVIINYIKENFGNVKTRILYRSTYVYAKILEESFLPIYLSDFSKRKNLFNYLQEAERETIGNSNIILEEVEQLENLDVPILYANSDCNSILNNDDNVIASNFYKYSGLSLAIELINNLSSDDKQRQMEIIELSFCIHEGYRIDNNIYKGTLFNFNEDFDYNDERDDNILINEVDLLYNKILENGFNSKEGYSHYGLVQTPSYTWGIGPQNWGLFDGLDGLSFFYLNKYKVQGDINALDIGKNFLNIGIKQFGDHKQFYDDLQRFNKISLFNYPISTFYVAEFYLEEGIDIINLNNDLIEKILLWITDNFEKDKDYDVLGGGAGTILYLLKLYDRLKQERILLLAKEIGYYLILNCQEGDEDDSYWVSIYGKAHTGFSHGAGGIAYALFKLNFYINTTDFVTYGIRALNYERSMFNKSGQYWNFFKIPKENLIIDTENNFWAYGSGGIALSRMLILKYFKDDKIIDEIEIAVNNITKKGWHANYNYSSGVFGNIDVLNMYSKISDNNILNNKILNLVKTIVEEKQQFSGWACAPVGKDYKSTLEMEGLFTGSSGIANTLLGVINFDKTSKLFE